MTAPGETLDDHIAKQCLEGGSTIWVRNRRKIDYVFHTVSRRLRAGGNVCEVGLGDGHLLRKLAARGLKVTGVDISPYLIDKLQEEFKRDDVPVELVCGDIAEAALPAESLDAVFCLDILEHLPPDSLPKALENFRQALTKGGVLVASVPLGENLADNIVGCPKCGHTFHRMGHYHSFDTIEQLQEAVGPAFKIVKVRSVPFNAFGSGLMNYVAFWTYRFLLKVAGLSKSKTICFIAEPEKP